MNVKKKLMQLRKKRLNSLSCNQRSMLQNLRKKKENSIKKSMILNKRKTQSSKQTKLKTWLKYKPFKKSQV